MTRTKQPQSVQDNVLIGVLVLIWTGALLFFWLADPTSQPNHHWLAGIVLSYLLLWSLVFVWSDESKIETAKRFLLTSTSVMFTVCLFEVLVVTRIIDFRILFGTPINKPWAHPDNLLDPKLLHIHKPHSGLRWEGIDYRYDQQGLRNESDFEAADLIVIGDSYIEGWGVSAPDLLTAQLATQLGRTVVNLGQSWYGPQQELELLRRYGLRLRPKVCVWAFFEGNDLKDVHRYNGAARNWEEFSEGLHSFKQRSFTLNAVLAVRRLLALIRHSNTAIADNSGYSSGIYEASPARKIRMYFKYKGHYLSARDEEALEQLRSILGQAYQLCDSSGAKFLVVFIPTKFRVYGHLTDFDTDAPPRYWVVNDLPARVGKIVREGLAHGHYLDLTPTFVEQAKDRAILYLPTDPGEHWSPEGHRAAATAIARFWGHWE